MIGRTLDVQPDTAHELLISAAKNQDQSATIALIGRCQRQIVAAIQSAGVSRYSSDFDDAQNTALLEIWRQFPNLRTNTSVCSWMFGIARRTTASRVIEPAARQRRRDERARQHTTSDSLRAPNPSDQVSERDRLTRVLDKLSTEHREVLILRYVLGYSEAEAAEQLGVAVNTVSSRTNRAKRAAIAELARQEEN